MLFLTPHPERTPKPRLRHRMTLKSKIQPHLRCGMILLMFLSLSRCFSHPTESCFNSGSLFLSAEEVARLDWNGWRLSIASCGVITAPWEIPPMAIFGCTHWRIPLYPANCPSGLIGGYLLLHSAP
jgi:hypothetical protein